MSALTARIAREKAAQVRALAAQKRARRIHRARTALDAIRDEPGEWEAVMQHYCRHCGGAPGCQCWNDE